jgi:hypothetical protein
MLSIYQRAKSEAKYNARLFLQMLDRNRGVATAKQLINSTNVSDGYTALNLRGRLDLTVEAMIIESPKWHSLFTEQELQRARKRLRDYDYVPRVSDQK